MKKSKNIVKKNNKTFLVHPHSLITAPLWRRKSLKKSQKNQRRDGEANPTRFDSSRPL